jgi:hypothetical protein
MKRIKKRTVHLTDRAMEIAQKQMEAFKAKFGRDPGPEDPLFFDPRKDTPQHCTPDSLMEIVYDAAVASGQNPYQLLCASRFTHEEAETYIRQRKLFEESDGFTAG